MYDKDAAKFSVSGSAKMASKNKYAIRNANIILRLKIHSFSRPQFLMCFFNL